MTMDRGDGFDVEHLERLGQDQLPLLLKSLHGKVMKLAMDPRGCRVVQRALEVADDYGRGMLTKELRGHVHEAVQSPHANHVLQRAIEFMRPSAVDFILHELVQKSRPAMLARHQYGCRVLERVIEHFPPDALFLFVNDIVEDTSELCRHSYGNFVVQHVLEHGEQVHRKRIIATLCIDLETVVLNQYACNVLDKALSYCALDDQRLLAHQIVNKAGLVATLSNSRYGHSVLDRLARVVEQCREVSMSMCSPDGMSTTVAWGHHPPVALCPEGLGLCPSVAAMVKEAAAVTAADMVPLRGGRRFRGGDGQRGVGGQGCRKQRRRPTSRPPLARA